MSSPGRLRLLQAELERNREALGHAQWTRRTYAERKRALEERLRETQRLLDNLERSHSECEEDAARAGREVARVEGEIFEERFGRKMAEVERLRARLAELGE